MPSSMKSTILHFTSILIIASLSAGCLTNYLPEQDKEYLKVAKSIIVAPDGTYVMAGTVDRDPTGYDFLLMKFDTAGSVIWKQVFDYGGMESAYAVEITPEGGYILTGSSSRGLYVVKTDSDGSKLWENSYGWYASGGQAIAPSGDSGYIICGYTRVDTLNEYQDAFILKIDPSGQLEWSKAFEYTSWNDNLVDVLVLADGAILVCGYKGATTCCGKGFLMKLTQTGDVIWSKPYEDPYFRSIEQTMDGGYILGGNLAIENINFNNRMGLLKTDSAGNEVWRQVITEDNYSYGIGVQQAANGYILAGFGQQSSVMNHVVLARIGPYGVLEWEKAYGDAGDMTMAWSVTLTPDNKILAAGEYSNPDKGIGVHLYLVKTDLQGNTIWTKVVE